MLIIDGPASGSPRSRVTEADRLLPQMFALDNWHRPAIIDHRSPAGMGLGAGGMSLTAEQ